MDPITQGLAGAALPQSVARRKTVAIAGLLGFLAGMTPDLDVLIRSDNDPLLFLEYHRQFTHSLIFIPLGGLICALLLHPLLARRQGLAFKSTWIFCTLGYATHGLLDACTTYGTLLFWPFSDVRIAWNTISIIDPLFSLPILAFLITGTLRKRPAWARLAMIWGLAYLCLGIWQRDVARDLGAAIAITRGHTPLELDAKPSFGNILVWKIVYRTEERFYVDAVRTGPNPRIYPGESLPVLDIDRDLPWLDPQSQQARDIERFRWFSMGYITQDPDNPNRIIDIRYSLLPNEMKALWSIQLDPAAGPGDHADYRTHRGDSKAALASLWRLISAP
ncbi:metal-dependent hydrolase [Chromatocurvus halotolerans]|uniref:Inner membrane protein n=1 Tax=Chromatocurvus halotolerans TaxID=1132028 RepID=A0A4R2L2E2_9GAMM|nr:metal-dependent hydrolase [Chromatocurvus halotolerans]TCO76728.1 inner membrane protein [Chromatocurvus halotolerans]